MFKIYVCFVLCFYIHNILCVTEEMQEILDMLHSTCKEQTEIEENVILDAQKGKFAADDKLGCYCKCIMVEMATMSDDGIVDVEATLALLPEEIRPKMEPTIRKCDTQVGADACDNALLTFKCYYENNKEGYFLP